MSKHIIHRIRHFLSARKLFEKLDEESRKNEFYFLLGIIVSLAGNFIVEVLADFFRNGNIVIYWIAFIVSIIFFAIMIAWVYSDYFKKPEEKNQRDKVK